MIPSSILSLASHKEKDAITPDQLEYRLAKPSYVLLGEMVEPEAGAVVASVEFGLVKRVDDCDFVGLPSLRVKEDWRSREVGSELLKALVKYVHAVGAPQAKFLWIFEWGDDPDVSEACYGAGFKAYFPDEGVVYAYNYPEDDKPTGDNSALPVIPDPRRNN
ncbi:hypothetical protein FOZ61_006974 [Perkinsus olseni]|uniref:N-acetyltransferase domain-containing protein n=1 Tax=Perkinsus olseni TaxID=32597 RepID=A0A7J6M9C6_PEROL|nr:hypothetical protein FOZ61_006974 [Perkinsus olseni]